MTIFSTCLKQSWLPVLILNCEESNTPNHWPVSCYHPAPAALAEWGGWYSQCGWSCCWPGTAVSALSAPPDPQASAAGWRTDPAAWQTKGPFKMQLRLSPCMAQPAQAVPVWLSLAQGGPKHSSSPLVSDRAHICGSAWLRLGQHPGPGWAHVWLSLAHAGPKHGSSPPVSSWAHVRLIWLMLGPSMAPPVSGRAHMWLSLAKAGTVCGSAWLRLGQCVVQLG